MVGCAAECELAHRFADRQLWRKVYRGKVHTISSESEAGKTWMALSAAIDEMAEGNHVCYLDFEDDEGGTVSRLLALQVARDMIRNQLTNSNQLN